MDFRNLENGHIHAGRVHAYSEKECRRGSLIHDVIVHYEEGAEISRLLNLYHSRRINKPQFQSEVQHPALIPVRV